MVVLLDFMRTETFVWRRYIIMEKSDVFRHYFRNGNLEMSQEVDSTGQNIIVKTFYENGNPKLQYTHGTESYHRHGRYLEWHQNGLLAVTGQYNEKKRAGIWREYYPSGQQRVEYTYNPKYKILYAWDESGVKIFDNGTGTVIIENLSFGEVKRTISQYKDYKYHGTVQSFIEGVPQSYSEYQNGIPVGYKREFYKNGNLKKESFWNDGVLDASKSFPKFDQPGVRTTIFSKVCVQCIEDALDYIQPENSPKLINSNKLEALFEVEPSLIQSYHDDFILTYSYRVFVNKSGHVVNARLVGADNGWILDQLEASVKQLQFKPARRSGKKVPCIYLVDYKFDLVGEGR